MTNLIDQFFVAYLEAFNSITVFTNTTPKEMMASPVNKEGWFKWKTVTGTLQDADYKNIEDHFNIELPKSFIDWHKAYFFLGGDCSILRLPTSNPNEPLQEIKRNLNWHVPQQLIPQKLYPFASEGNDTGPLVFDARSPLVNNEFPIRIYNQEFGGDIEGLGEIIFSSFRKLLECLTHYLTQLKTRKSFEIIPDFFQIDPAGAGKQGRNYWLGFVG